MSGYSIKNGRVLLETEDNSHQGKREGWLVRRMIFRPFFRIEMIRFFFTLFSVTTYARGPGTCPLQWRKWCHTASQGWVLRTTISNLRRRSLKFDLRCGAYLQI